MKLTVQQQRTARAIIETPSDDFASLVQAARLDRTRAFREADLRHVDFGTADLARFDFTGADLRGADLSRARNKGAAVFAGVVADAMTRGLPLPPPPADFDLKEAHRLILAGKAPPTPWFPYITELSFQGKTLSDLTPLTALNALQRLDLDGTQVSDLTPLAALNALQSLYLNSTRVSDLTPLAALNALQDLRLDRTQVSDLTPLATLNALQYLDLDGTQVSDVSMLRQKGLRIDGLRDDVKKNPATGAKKQWIPLSAPAGRLLRTKT